MSWRQDQEFRRRLGYSATETGVDKPSSPAPEEENRSDGWRDFNKAWSKREMEKHRGPVKTLANMTPEQRAALEKQYGCKIKAKP